MKVETIETAPKDGSRILLWGDARIREYVPDDCERDWYIGFWNDRLGFWDGDDDGWIFAPTHWSPLPAAPAILKSNRKATGDPKVGG